ncbi:microphthalmia-associated transcription factor-like isoform X2 [Lineus longissimus]|uniref:microphthalmia-associated transcription factor-like isoform X2 n=1 Tax=Lineus longissimus TaxID=88925 RepID=UPI002B4C2E9E
MNDSGIDFDFESLLQLPDVSEEDLELPEFEGEYYEIKSKPDVAPSQTDVKNKPMTMRTNLRLQLMRQQLADEEQKEHQMRQQMPPSQYRQTTDAIHMPVSVSPSEVPAQIYKVQTRLENPTKYHVQQKQQRQIQMFLSQSQGKGTVHSFPGVNLGNLTTMTSSCPTDPPSPLSIGMSSTATSLSEVDELLGDIASLESVDATIDGDLSLIEPTLTHMSQTVPGLPQSKNVYDMFNLTTNGASHKQANSCPSDFNLDSIKEEMPPYSNHYLNDDNRAMAKDRQKKDNHNIIERRRRVHINERIKELGTLLPKSCDPDMRQNKGTILKASVDYIRRLRRSDERLHQVEAKSKNMESANRKMMLRIQQLEMMMKMQGLNVPDSELETTDCLTQVLHQSTGYNTVPSVRIKRETDEGPTPTVIHELMDDSSPVCGDPMLSSPLHQSRCSSVSMDDSMLNDCGVEYVNL